MLRDRGSVLVVDDDKYICDFISRCLTGAGFATLMVFDGEAALDTMRSQSPDVAIVDVRLPGMNGFEVLQRAKSLNPNLAVILTTGYPDVQGAVAAMKAGANDYLVKPLKDKEVIGLVLQALKQRKLKAKFHSLTDHVAQTGSVRDAMGRSETVCRLVSEIERVAKSNFNVLILGETGVGKELVARAIHQASLRAKGPFVPVDCGSIPETLMESELFGHEKGAFTGADVQTAGKFEAASNGTLFLDEICNLPLSSQAKLLRAVQDKIIYRVGSTKPIDAQVRLVAAGSDNMPVLVGSNVFRSDLFFRLSEFTIEVPPLRRRTDDILFLAQRILDLTNMELNKNVRGFSESTIQTLLTYSWPGNVRQLQSTIRRAALLADEVIDEKHLDITRRPGLEFSNGNGTQGRPFQKVEWGHLPLREIVHRSTVCVEREVLIEVLRTTGGNKAKAARLLHVDYKTIHSKVKEYGIEIDEGDDYAQAR